MEEKFISHKEKENIQTSNTGFWKVLGWNYFIMIFAEVSIFVLAIGGGRMWFNLLLAFPVIQAVVCLILGIQVPKDNNDGSKIGYFVSAFFVPISLLIIGYGGCLLIFRSGTF